MNLDGVVSAKETGGRIEMDKALIVDRLSELRKAKGMTAKDCSEVVGLSPTYWSQMERRRGAPSIKVVLLLARHIGVGLEELCGPEHEFMELPLIQLSRMRKRVNYMERSLGVKHQ